MRSLGNVAPAGLAPELARQIVERACERKWAVGDHLPALRLARAFGVSPSPIRGALKLLRRLDIVESRPNRGFFLTADKAGLARARDALKPLDTDDEGYLTLVADRLAGRLPEAFREADLMRRYDISRAQLQAMLLKIEHNGWIERKSGYGWAFLPVLTSHKAHAQSYQFRMGFEPAALLEPTFTVDGPAFAEARLAQEKLLAEDAGRVSREAVFETGAAFHEMLMRCSGNPFYLEALKRQNRLRRLIEHRGAIDADRLVRQCRAHLRILDLLEAGQNERAAEIMREHLGEALRAVTHRRDTGRPAAAPPGELHL
jgi:DNA-binding GntR family transcriptional regulator